MSCNKLLEMLDLDSKGVSTRSVGASFASLSNNRITQTEEDDDEKKYKQRKNYQKKQAYTIKLNVEEMAKKYGTEKLGFLTLTFADNLQFTSVDDWKESQRRFNSYLTGILRDIFDDYMIILEPQQSGRIHYHLLVACRQDIRTGVNFDQISAKNYTSASNYLRDLWKLLRETSKKYGFGRTELLPIKSNSEAVGVYVGSYLAGDSIVDIFGRTGKRFRGRRIRYSQGWKIANTRFAFVSSGTQKYRQMMQKISEKFQIPEHDFKSVFGSKWNWQYRDLIVDCIKNGLTDENLKIWDMILKTKKKKESAK